MVFEVDGAVDTAATASSLAIATGAPHSAVTVSNLDKRVARHNLELLQALMPGHQRVDPDMSLLEESNVSSPHPHQVTAVIDLSFCRTAAHRLARSRVLFGDVSNMSIDEGRASTGEAACNRVNATLARLADDPLEASQLIQCPPK